MNVCVNREKRPRASLWLRNDDIRLRGNQKLSGKHRDSEQLNEGHVEPEGRASGSALVHTQPCRLRSPSLRFLEASRSWAAAAAAVARWPPLQCYCMLQLAWSPAPLSWESRCCSMHTASASWTRKPRRHHESISAVSMVTSRQTSAVCSDKQAAESQHKARVERHQKWLQITVHQSEKGSKVIVSNWPGHVPRRPCDLDGQKQQWREKQDQETL